MTDVEVGALPDAEVLLLRPQEAFDDEMLAALKERLNEIGRHPLIIVLPQGSTLEALDDDEMRAHGWVRAPAPRAESPGDAHLVVEGTPPQRYPATYSDSY